MATTLDDLTSAMNAFVKECRTQDAHSTVTGDVLASFGGLVAEAITMISHWQEATDSQLSEHFHQEAQVAYQQRARKDVDPPDKRAAQNVLRLDIMAAMHPILLLQQVVLPWLLGDVIYRASISNDENIRRMRAAAEKVQEALRILEEGK